MCLLQPTSSRFSQGSGASRGNQERRGSHTKDPSLSLRRQQTERGRLRPHVNCPQRAAPAGRGFMRHVFHEVDFLVYQLFLLLFLWRCSSSSARLHVCLHLTHIPLMTLPTLHVDAMYNVAKLPFWRRMLCSLYICSAVSVCLNRDLPKALWPYFILTSAQSLSLWCCVK